MTVFTGQFFSFKMPVTTYTTVHARVNNTNSVTQPVIVFNMTSNCFLTHFSDLLAGDLGEVSAPDTERGVMLRKRVPMGEEEISSPPE